MTPIEFKKNYSHIPEEPGVYMYYDNLKKLLYVGKAKNLKKRISNYFQNKKHDSQKTNILVSQIKSIDFHIVNTEHDALLLENNFIKTEKPPFNISLKDDKTYPYIIIKNEDFPRVYLTRRYRKDGSEYYGPYTSVSSAYDIMDFIRENIQLRNCSLDLSEKAIAKEKYKACLQFHLKKCKAPCISLQSKNDYDEDIQAIKQILKGRTKEVLNFYKDELKKQIENLQFEKADDTNKKIKSIYQFQSQSIIQFATHLDIDVMAYIEDEESVFFTYFMVIDGTLIRTHQQKISKALDETIEEIIVHFLLYIRSQYQSKTKEIVIQKMMEVPSALGFELQVPKSGNKKKLLDLCMKNTELYIEKNNNEEKEKVKNKKLKMILLKSIQEKLGLKKLPNHIECFDNSNIQGSAPVAAMVCFKEGMASKKDYRKFHIKSVVGPNDFASMEEIVYRRYFRLIKEERDLPDLVIIDGGKGQLSSAMNSIKKLGLEDKIEVVGLAKKKEEIFFPEKGHSIELEFDSPELNLIRNIRDEVHRFGITFHRKTRSKASLTSKITPIKGIGEKTMIEVLKNFKSIKSLTNNDLLKFQSIFGDKRGKIILDLILGNQ